MGWSSRIILLLTPALMEEVHSDIDATTTLALVECIGLDVSKAQDNLLTAKINQAEFVNHHRVDKIPYTVGDKVMLSTQNHRREYMQKNSGCVAKFMPRWDSPFIVTKSNPAKSLYTLDLPNELNRFPVFHVLQLRKHIPNDDDLFPSCKLPKPGPVVTDSGKVEWLIDCILDECACGHDRQFLV
jgi:hypothetical protein